MRARKCYVLRVNDVFHSFKKKKKYRVDRWDVELNCFDKILRFGPEGLTIS